MKKPLLVFLILPSVFILLGSTAIYYYILFTDNAVTVGVRSVTQTAASTFSNSRSTAQEEVVLGRLAVPSDPCCPDKAVPPPTVKEQKIQDRLGLLLEEYSRKHKVWRKAFLQGDNSVKTLTWTCTGGGAGGIGDRIQGITFSFALAILSDRLFLIQWTSKPFKEDFQKHLFVLRSGAIDWDVDAKLVERLDSLKNQTIQISAPRFLESHAGHINSLKQHIIAPVSTHVKIRTNLDLFSEFIRVVSLAELKQMVNGREDKIDFMTHGNPYNDQIGSALSRQLFKYNPFLVEKASEMTRKLSISEDQPYTAVHLRTGDFGNMNEHLRNGITNAQSIWQILLDCAVNRSQEILGPNTPIVLFTDSPQAKEWTSKTFRDQVKPYPGQPMHMAMMSMTRSEEIAMGAELVAMSRASVLIRARLSGFSEVSMRMCPFNSKHVFRLDKCR